MPILFIEFFWTVLVGAVLFAIVWLLTRTSSGFLRIWRLMLSLIAALAVTPTIMNICGQDYIAPASLTAVMVFAPDAARCSIGLVHGVLPLLALASAVFFIWSYFVEKKSKVH